MCAVNKKAGVLYVNRIFIIDSVMQNLDRIIFEDALAGYWDWNIAENTEYLSIAFKALFGYNDEELPNTPDAWKQLIMPEDLGIVLLNFKDHVKSRGKIPYRGEVRFKHKNGSVIWVAYTGRVVEWGENDKALRMVGCHIDISKQKAVQKELERTEQLLNKTNQVAMIGGWELDMETEKITWTQVTRQIHEVADDFIPERGKTARYFKEGEHRDKITKAFKKAIADGTPYDMEVILVTDNGKELWTRCIGVADFENGKCKRVYGTIQDITRQRQEQEAFRRNEQMLSETQALTHCGSWEQNLITKQNYWSPEAFRIFGLEPKGTGPDTETFDSMIHPDDRERYIDTVRKAIQEGVSVQTELRILMPDGRIKYIEAFGEPGFDDNGAVIKLHGAIQDITARKQSEAQIRLKQNQLKNFVEYTPAAIAMLDRDMRYIAVSGVWSNSYQLKEQSIVGKSHYELFPELPAQWKEYHQRGLAGEVVKCEEESFTRNDGQTEWLKWEIRPWFERENEVGGIIIFTEVITAQKEAKEALIKAKEQAEQAAQAKTRFLSTMSHEIRTPMNAVIGFTHLLMQNPREDQMEYLKTLQFSAENLMVLINDILDFNKIEAGKIEFEEVDLSIRDLMNNIRAAFLQRAREKGIGLTLEVDKNIPPVLKGDPVRIGQIVTNLVSNAIKFTHQGDVTVTVSLVAENVANATIHFEVNDTGIGIPENKHQYIFETFTQGSSDTTRKYGGTGLGLTITRRLLELQGSKINLESVQGEGARFYFDLTLKTSDTPLGQPEKPAEQMRLKTLKGIKVLVAEDNQINVLLLKHFFKQWEVEFDVAENGALALERVKEQDYDVILMDIQMPEMDGYEATGAIRKLPGERFKKLPIIALTASALLSIKYMAYVAGMNDYISKPFKPEVLYQKLSMHSGRSRMKVPFEA